ncbi:hypothetical protein PanWU01x14_104220 [Parasponia andersonii]|uniref:Uncharacterized protein n=1 Tax=Parasponia andersonii TaxID=3476 RepID=A0A2P5D1U1_PARAD|nr:hypothetical protein PanWU01x14_104220 [Parasponia andersonii]
MRIIVIPGTQFHWNPHHNNDNDIENNHEQRRSSGSGKTWATNNDYQSSGDDHYARSSGRELDWEPTRLGLEVKSRAKCKKVFDDVYANKEYAHVFDLEHDNFDSKEPALDSEDSPHIEELREYEKEIMALIKCKGVAEDDKVRTNVECDFDMMPYDNPNVAHIINKLVEAVILEADEEPGFLVRGAGL